VKLFTDNQNVSHILQVGSKALQRKTLLIFSLCVHQNISIEPEWVPQAENELADYISHIDGSLTHLCLSGLIRNGPHVLLTILPASLIPNFLDLIADFTTQVAEKNFLVP